MQSTYEAPKLTAVGSLKDLTLGRGIRGNDDSLIFFGHVIAEWGVS